MTDTQRLEALRAAVFAQQNDHCFLEREHFLNTLSPCEPKPADYFARIFSDLMDRVSTPIHPADYFVGRVVEGPPENSKACPNRLLFAKGHLTPDYRRLLTLGYGGILRQIQASAARLGTREAADYAGNAELVIGAICRFAARYAEAARARGMERAAEALCRVPYEPAYDLYSALQSVWLVHMIASCYMGSRDYGFGYMDEYLYPYYLKEKEQGATDEEISVMLSGFFMKPNEICGRHPHNYRCKPVLSHSSKQYVLLDGGRANHLSELILDAVRRNAMAQPELTVILTDESTPAFRRRVFETMSVLTDKLQVYGGERLRTFWRRKGLPEELASRPAFTACCTPDVYCHSCREEFYLPTVQLFCETLYNGEHATKEEFLYAYGKAVTAACEAYLEESRVPDADWARCAYLMDTLLLGDCNERCAYPPLGLTYRAKNIFLPGVATLGDSLCALDRLVFRGSVPYGELVDLLRADFVGNDALFAAIKGLPKFGNDGEADAYAAEMATVMIDAVERASHTPQELVLPSLYSLERNNAWASDIPATPDGRRAGTPFSENQSPTYGADRSGITTLLNSLARLPFERTAGGGLNLTFSFAVEPAVLQALVETYLAAGGLHVGITVVDPDVLRDAMRRPERYQSLTVRMYGFSEYFVGLPKWQQLAVLARTAYGNH